MTSDSLPPPPSLHPFFSAGWYHSLDNRVKRFPKQASPVENCALGSICLFFFAVGRALIPHLGLQNDEALFAWVIYEPKAGAYAHPFLGTKVPLMLMSYLGALKGWIYRRIFQLVRPTISSIRVPMLLAGVATLWLFYQLVRRIAGTRAAMAACLLLAADSIFLLTTCFDWGPVALQHLLLMGGMLLVLKFYQDKSEAALGWGFFLFGLGMWDKALMVWMLGGIAVAGLLTFPRQLLASFTVKRLAVVVLAFGLGALPLLIYNLETRWDTFRGNASLDFSDMRGKAWMLASTLSGDALFGWMVAEDQETPKPHPPATLVQRGAFALSDATGHPRHSLM